MPGNPGKPCPAAQRPKHGIQESFKLKRTFLLSILALVSAALLPLAATSQVVPARGSRSVDQGEPSEKYSVFVGFGYSSLNQVNLSRSGLVGAEVDVTRNFGKYFGVMADGSYYKYAIVSGNPGKPSLDSLLFGPEIHAPLFKQYSGFLHALIGGEHSAGESQTPNISFAGGFGGGMEYMLGPHLSIRASGDYIGASFSPINNSKQLGYSPHLTFNDRASFGAVYRF
jgi:hypothetical protein